MRHVAHLECIDALALLAIRGDTRDLPMINAQIDLPINGRSHKFSRETCEMSELVSNGWHLMTTFLLYRQAMQGVDSSFFFYIHSGHERGNPSYTAHTHSTRSHLRRISDEPAHGTQQSQPRSNPSTLAVQPLAVSPKRKWPQLERQRSVTTIQNAYLSIKLTGQNVRQIATQPMSPVEVRTLLIIWSGTEQCANGLNETENHSDQPGYGMRMPYGTL